MSEDRLERALESMKQEAVDADDARGRARPRLERSCPMPPARPARSSGRTSAPTRAERWQAAGACFWKTTSAGAPRAASRWPI